MEDPVVHYVKHTLIVLTTPREVLLGYKKRGQGAGKWNCFGGKIEKDESIRKAAVRELKEESGLNCEEEDLKHVGMLDFGWIEKPVKHLDYVFRCENFTGEIVETEEMRPQWFEFGKIPYQQMWNSDRMWLPLVLENKPFKGYFLYNAKGDIMEAKINDGIPQQDIINESQTPRPS